jgi:hypothetical protein
VAAEEGELKWAGGGRDEEEEEEREGLPIILF